MPSTSRETVPSTTKSTASSASSPDGRGCSLPPPGATSTTYQAKVSAKPDSGRASTHSRVRSHSGSRLATMSRIVSRGSTA